MDAFNAGQVIVSTVATTLVVTPLLVLSYLAGRRSRSQGRSWRLDQLKSEFVLGGSTWRAEFDGDADPAHVQTVLFAWEQTGCRIMAVGDSNRGVLQTLEGVIHECHICCVLIDESRAGIGLGMVTAELLPGGEQMTGMRTRWSPESQTLMVRKVTFTRLHTGVSIPEPGVSR
jgi:hypothetical protein